ncbi:MAG: TRAP transporter small permease [Rhodobacter sp.]|nr:TRAP transporter small permease [Paracoccaceae bacterium]MCC0077577.1 TRAP transporter small permease [Rhodobacter sp.]
MPPFATKLAHGFTLLLALVLLAMVGLSAGNVVARYLFNAAILWADEIAVFGMILLTWLGAIVVAWRGSDIRMDLLVAALPRGAQRPVAVLQDLVVAGSCGWVAWLSYGYVTRVHRIGMTSDSARLPVWPVHAVIPVALAAIALIALVRALRTLRRPQTK